MGSSPTYTALQLCCTVDVDGQPESCAITAEALEDHFGARSALEADLRDAFERGRALTLPCRHCSTQQADASVRTRIPRPYRPGAPVRPARVACSGSAAAGA
ncbi:DUF1488 family protein [Burkholderia sp. BE17]|uniref:DUF1488 family protein n=1 Tax=Burkholderia sp. BE17 TaxID=2656644 RepID=UPI00128D3675|nr:DUF1488 family protein [Burkholderia sp. BE17]